jgi:hypothetical protein
MTIVLMLCALAQTAAEPKKPDYYCNKCVKEKRIPGPLQPERLMERDGKQIRETLEDKEEFTFIETDHVKLLTDLPSVNVKLDFDPKMKEELKLLHEIFPSVSENTTTLTEHQVAHLMSNQCTRLYRELLELLGVDPKASLGWGPHMGQKGKFEVYLFRRERVYQRFSDLYVGKQASHGQEHNNFGDDALAYLTFMGGEASTFRDFRAHVNHKVSHIFLRGYRHYSTELPAWIIEGHGHWRERLDQDRHDTFCYSEASLVSGWRTSKWKVKVRKMVEAGRFTPLPALAGKQQAGELTADERGQAWSMVMFMIENDVAGFRKLIDGWKALQKIPDYMRVQEELMQKAFGLSLNQFTERWKEHVLKTYPKV